MIQSHPARSGQPARPSHSLSMVRFASCAAAIVAVVLHVQMATAFRAPPPNPALVDATPIPNEVHVAPEPESDLEAPETPGIGPGSCTQPPPNCQDRPSTQQVGGNAADFAFRCADDFQTATTGVIDSVCVWGAYRSLDQFNGGFELRYYADDGANGPDVPGTLFASFSELSGSLFVTPRVATGQNIVFGGTEPPYPVFENVLQHQPLSVPANVCAWIEIRNIGPVQWFWIAKNAADNTGNNRKAFDFNRNQQWDAADVTVRDMAFCIGVPMTGAGACIDLPTPTNTSCGTAMQVDCNSRTIATNIYGNPLLRIPPNAPMPCITAAQGSHPLWFSFVAQGPTALIQTCASPIRLDSVITIYDGGCGGPIPIGCSDNECGATVNENTSLHGFVRATGLVAGQTYFVQLAAKSVQSLGSYALDITCPAEPDNDLCENAQPIEPNGPPISGTTRGATIDLNAPSPCDSGVDITAPGVWYRVLGTGRQLTASLCNATNYDSQISVYCGDCHMLTCIDGDDDGCGPVGGASVVTWCSQAGVEYRILVHGFQTAVGEFTLTLTEQPIPCPPFGQCQACSNWQQNTIGVWSNSSQWNPPIVPNNMPPDQRFCVAIQGENSIVFLDIDATIDSLMVDEGDLNIFNGSLRIATSGGVFNRNTITIGPGESLSADADMSFTGPGPLHLAGVDATIASAAGNTITNSVSHLIDGFGIVDSDFDNDGTIRANVDMQTLFIRGPSLINDGLIESTLGGNLVIEDNIGSGGGGIFRATGANFLVDTASAVADCIEVLPGSLSFFIELGSVATPSVIDAREVLITGGRFSVLNHSTLNVSDRIVICPAPGAIAELIVDESSVVNGDIDLCTNGLLGGSGDINGDVNNGGGIEPGMSPGLMSITGAYTQTAAGSMRIEIAGTTPITGYDVVSITGMASLGGALQVVRTGGYIPTDGDSFVLLTTTGGLGGTYGSVALLGMPPNFFATVSYSATDVTLTLNRVPCAACDVNCDGLNDAADIQSFVNRLLGGGGGCSACAGDLNDSGAVTSDDVAPFVSCLLTP